LIADDFKSMNGVDIAAGTKQVPSLCGYRLQGGTPCLRLFRIDRELRPGLRLTGRHRADEREYQQTANQNFDCFQCSAPLNTCNWNCLVFFGDTPFSGVSPKNSTSFYLMIGNPKWG